MIGVKTLAVVAAGGRGGRRAAWARGLLDPRYLDSLSAASCIAVGALAAPDRRADRGRLAARRAQPRRRSMRARASVRVAGRRAIELPAAVQHALFATAVGLRRAERLHQPGHRAADSAARGAGRAIVEPAVRPRSSAAPARPAAPAPEIPGCALVRRAFQLGYTKSLGLLRAEDRRGRAGRDRPRRARCARTTSRCSTSPGGAWSTRSARSPRWIRSPRHRTAPPRWPSSWITSTRSPAHQGHAVAAHPRASHHLWINLPAPLRVSWLRALVDPARCAEHAEHVPLWRGWTDQPEPASALVDDVVGAAPVLARLRPAAGAVRRPDHPLGRAGRRVPPSDRRPDRLPGRGGRARSGARGPGSPPSPDPAGRARPRAGPAPDRRRAGRGARPGEPELLRCRPGRRPERRGRRARAAHRRRRDPDARAARAGGARRRCRPARRLRAAGAASGRRGRSRDIRDRDRQARRAAGRRRPGAPRLSPGPARPPARRRPVSRGPLAARARGPDRASIPSAVTSHRFVDGFRRRYRAQRGLR